MTEGTKDQIGPPSGAGEAATIVIAAYNAAAFIAPCLRSALAQTGTCEVILVDDASRDETVSVARACDDGTGRLNVLVQDRNQGPAAARNRAIDAAKGDWIALLDADDRMQPGRICALMARATAENWDFIADDIVRVQDWDDTGSGKRLWKDEDFGSVELDLAGFILQNMPHVAGQGRELGFIKPLMRRNTLERHALRYDERLRLGEDFNLYARALASGVRFGLVDPCGYVAFDTPGSLSKRHNAADLEHLYRTTKAMARMPDLSARDRRALATYLDYAHKRWGEVRLMESWARRDFRDFAGAFAAPPGVALAMIGQVVDKLARVSRLSREPG